MDTVFTERELAEDAAGRWWMFLVTGIGWLVFSLLVFQWDYTTIYAISILFGIVEERGGMSPEGALDLRRKLRRERKLMLLAGVGDDHRHALPREIVRGGDPGFSGSDDDDFIHSLPTRFAAFVFRQVGPVGLVGLVGRGFIAVSTSTD